MLPPELAVKPRAQIRVRLEEIGDKTLKGAPEATVISHRARAGLDAVWKDTARLVFEIQDVRNWGGDTVAPLLPPDPTVFGQTPGSLDLHQAFMAVMSESLEARVGRQEISFSNERILGSADFGQLGRSFDAVRVGSAAGKPFSWLAFLSSIRDPDVQPGTEEIFLWGVGVEHKVSDAFRYAPILLLESDEALAQAPLYKGTFGARVDGNIGAFNYDLDGYGQAGWLGKNLSAAFLLGGRLRYQFDTFLSPKLGVFSDYVSGGNAATDSISTFSTTYGTNHKFYGYQDLFTNLPLHTANQGLWDSGGALWLQEGDISGQFAFHVFSATDYQGSGSALYGMEPDFVIRFNTYSFYSLELGGSLFIPAGDALGRGTTPTPWTYVAFDMKI